MEMVRGARWLHTQRGSNLTIEFWLDSIQPFTTVNSVNDRGPILFLLMVNSIMTVIGGWRTHRGSNRCLLPVYWKTCIAAESTHQENFCTDSSSSDASSKALTITLPPPCSAAGETQVWTLGQTSFWSHLSTKHCYVFLFFQNRVSTKKSKRLT